MASEASKRDGSGERPCGGDRTAPFLTPDVWSGRALQEVFVDLADAVLHQCIRPLIGAWCAPGHHGYQRACDLISGSASKGRRGHQCSHAPGRPILHLVSSSRRPRQVKAVGYVIDSPSFAPFLCSCLAAVPSSRPARADAPRARGRQGWPSRMLCRSLPCCQATP